MAELAGRLLDGGPAGISVAHAPSLAAAGRAAGLQWPGCVLVHAGVPDAGGDDGRRRLEGLAARLPMVVLTAAGDGDDAFAIAAIEAGAHGHLGTERADGDALRRAIRLAVARRRSEAGRAYRTLHDALTGLPNRAVLVDRLRLALARARDGDGDGTALVLADVRALAAINDRAGHAAGDEALAAVAERLRAAVGAADTVARLGADEFAVLCDGVADAAGADAIAARVAAAVAEPPVSAGGLPVVLDVGSAWTRDPGCAPDELLRRADRALAAAYGRVADASAATRRGPEDDGAAYLRTRRAAERRLREAEERFRGVFEQAPLGMALAETEDGRLGRLVRVNGALAAIVGVPADALLATDMASLLHPGDRPALAEAVARVLAGADPADLELRRDDDGDGVRWLRIFVSSLHDQPSRHPTALLQVGDVTDRRRSEAALRRSEAEKTAILESALDCVVTIDGAGRVLRFNAAAEATFGYRREDAIGRDVADLIVPPGYRELHRDALRDALRGGSAHMLGRRAELVGMRSDGSQFPLEVAIAATGSEPATFTGFLRDLSGRRQSEDATARLAAIVDSSEDAILSKDLDGTITSWNAGAERLYGYAAEEAIGSSIDIILADRREKVAIFDALAAGRRTEPYETVRRRRDGSTVDVSVSISPVRDATGRVVGGAAIARDITAAKSAQAALRRSERRHRTLVSQLPDAVVYQYDRNFRIVLADGPLLVERGLTSRDLVGTSLWDLLRERQAGRLAAHFRAALDGETRSFEWCPPRDDRIFDVDVVPLRDDDGRVTGGMVLGRDVTERKRIERSLLVQARLLDRLEVAVAATDLEGRVTHWNRQAERYYGRSRAEVLGTPIAELNAAYGLPEARGILDRLLAGGMWQEEYDLTLADGTVATMFLTASALEDEAGAPVGFASVSVDVSARVAAANELHRAREQFEGAFEHAPVGMALVATAGEELGAIMRVNGTMCRMLGAASVDLIGRSFSGAVDPDDLARLRPAVERVLSGADDGFHAGARLLAEDGATVWSELSVSLVRDLHGAPLHAVVLVQDVTEARRAEGERRALEARLQQSEKLDTIGRLAGGIAHDFNNLLSVILNYAEYLADDLPADGPLHRDAERIKEAGERAAALTRQLLAFARREVVQPRPLDLNEIVAETELLLGRTIGEDVELRAEPAAGLRAVCADQSQIEQVVLNLAVNGRDAMADGGTLTIATTNVELDGAAPGRYVQLTVSDTGSGMAPEVAEQAFEPFFTTKPAGEGTGLGLATVYGIVTQAGGQVELCSAPGRGTTVKVTLPACADAPAAERAEPQTVPAGRGETVLVVEDEPEVATLIREILCDAGYHVLQAGNAAAAIELAATTTPDLLLTDVVMPDMSGTELARAIRRDHPAARVLYTSGYTDDVVVRHGVLERRIAFLEKPFTRATLLPAVRAAIDGVASPEGDDV